MLIHCRGGLGRAGTIAARLLVELGMRPDEAVRRVRDARGPGAIETPAQEAHVLGCVPQASADPFRTMESIRNRALGAFLGLAVGDAVGTTLEFSPRDAQPRLVDMVGGGPFELTPGAWTDDTAMALALADSLAASRGPRLSGRDGPLRRLAEPWRIGGTMATIPAQGGVLTLGRRPARRLTGICRPATRSPARPILGVRAMAR